ncbi:cell division cycle- protein [Marasmius sp. AFHP31]|nr:cell division cycle- protein [Marasmius sp. AFHP31]
MILDLVSSAAYKTADDKRPETEEVTYGVLKRVLAARLELTEDDSLIPDARAVLASAVIEDEPSYVYPFGHVSTVLTKIAEILSLANASPTNAHPVLSQSTIQNTPTTSPYHVRLSDAPIESSSASTAGLTTRSSTSSPYHTRLLDSAIDFPSPTSTLNSYTSYIGPIKLPGEDTIPSVVPELKLEDGINDGGSVVQAELSVEDPTPPVNSELKSSRREIRRGSMVRIDLLVEDSMSLVYSDRERLGGIIEKRTLTALLELLISPNSRALNVSPDLRAFAMTFRMFTTVDELFDMIGARLQRSQLATTPPGQWDAGIEALCERVLSCLEAIVGEDSFDIKSHMHLIARIEDLFRITGVGLGRHAKAQSILDEARRRSITNNHSPSAIQHRFTIQSPAVFSVRSSMSERLLEFEPSELAAQLTLMESFYYQKIRPVDCLRYMKEPETNVSAFLTFNNAIADWALACVRHTSDPLVFEHLIEVADECRALDNHATMASLLSGLSMTSYVENTSDPTRYMDNFTQRRWQACEAFALQIQDPEAYNAIMGRVRFSPAIPSIGHVLDALQSIEPRQVVMSRGHQGLIDFRKYKKLCKALDNYLWWRRFPYKLSSSDLVQDYLSETLSQSSYGWALHRANVVMLATEISELSGGLYEFKSG